MGSSIDVLHEAFKIAHTYTFLTKNFYGFEIVFFALWFWDFLHVLYAYYAERKFCHKYTYALSPVWNRPPYTRIICEKNFAQIYMKNRGAAGMMCARLIGVDISAFVCITFCICGHRLKKVVFVVDWLMSKFDYKSVIKLYKFIVKMWLCICNCMCICVCIWRWLWLVIVLIR